MRLKMFDVVSVLIMCQLLENTGKHLNKLNIDTKLINGRAHPFSMYAKMSEK